MNSVWPSGFAFAGGCRRQSARAGAVLDDDRLVERSARRGDERAVASVTLPAANGVMIVTGRVG